MPCAEFYSARDAAIVRYRKICHGVKSPLSFTVVTKSRDYDPGMQYAYT